MMMLDRIAKRVNRPCFAETGMGRENARLAASHRRLGNATMGPQYLAITRRSVVGDDAAVPHPLGFDPHLYQIQHVFHKLTSHDNCIVCFGDADAGNPPPPPFERSRRWQRDLQPSHLRRSWRLSPCRARMRAVHWQTTRPSCSCCRCADAGRSALTGGND